MRVDGALECGALLAGAIGYARRIGIEVPLNASQDSVRRYKLDDDSMLDDSSASVTTSPVADQYRLQAEAFSRAVRLEQPHAVSLDDAVRSVRTIDALFASARTVRFEAV